MLTCHNWLLALWRAKEFSKEISRVRFKSLAKFFVETTVKIVMLSLKKLAPKVYRILNFTKVKDFVVVVVVAIAQLTESVITDTCTQCALQQQK